MSYGLQFQDYFVTFVLGGLIVLVMPFSTQPRVSLRISQVPSAKNFFVDIEGPILPPVSAGAGKMYVIAWIRQRVSLLIYFLLVVCMRDIKSSMYTSRRWNKLRLVTSVWGVCPI